jgi:hypothetical protein
VRLYPLPTLLEHVTSPGHLQQLRSVDLPAFAQHICIRQQPHLTLI